LFGDALIVNKFDHIMVDCKMHIAQHLKGKMILNIGCGEGADAAPFCVNRNQVFGVDLSYRVSDKYKHFSFLLADARRLPVKDNCFDFIVSLDVIEHIPDDDLFISEAFRVTKAGGYCLIGTPNRLRLSKVLMKLLGEIRSIDDGTYYNRLGHQREYNMEDLRLLIEKSGFELRDCRTLWLGLTGRINKGLSIFPRLLSRYAQYLLMTTQKPYYESARGIGDSNHSAKP
jgi:ubiquinone/menaquinone biosynthesis C-methylase UbiE